MQLKKEECFYLGKIVRTHGVKGDVMILVDSDDPQRYKKIKSILIETDEELISHNISDVSIRNDIAKVHIKGVDDMTKAEGFLKCEVYLPLSLLPEPGENKFYLHEIINFKVIDKTKGEIGIFEKVVDLPQQIIGQIKNGNKEILVPMIPEFIERVDREEKILFLNLPDGLVDLYLTP
ncbi:MAG: ribosome maturation factor RimM [Bacteroidota bacterium]